MKFNFIKFVFKLFLFVFSANCFANLYFGADLKYMNLSYNKNAQEKFNSLTDNKKMEKPKGALGVFIGYNFSKCLGIEIGYDCFSQKKGSFNKKDLTFTQNNQTLKTPTAYEVKNNKYIDLMGYHDLDDNNIALIGSIGIGFFENKLERKEYSRTLVISPNSIRYSLNKEESSKDSTDVGIRLGAGIKFKLNEKLDGRALIKWQKVKKEFVKSGIFAGIGITYNII